MNKLIAFFAAALTAGLMLSGCAVPQPPAETNAGMNGLQQRVLHSRNIGEDLDATYNDVWYSTIATLQLNGFLLKQADKNSGFIYGVWKDTYEAQRETSNGGFSMFQVTAPASYSFGLFSSKTTVFKQVEVSVTMERLARTQTLVRLTSRFDSDGAVMAEGVFANRFFGLLRKEIFLRKNNGSIYHTSTKK